MALAAVAVLGATALLPARVEQVAREVEKVRGRRFESAVPASEIDAKELKKVLRSKVAESFPASPEETLRTLVALGLIDETPNLLDRLVDFYASQVIAFYDPEPRKFYVVRGAEKSLAKNEGEAREEVDLEGLGGVAGMAGMAGMAEKLIFAHELTHALQDETLKLDRRMKDLKENGDRGLALQSLLEGEATLVMVRVALAGLPGADENTEEMLGPLLSAGALERSGVPKDLPDYFVDQLFFPYADGTAFVRRVVKTRGWAGVDRLWKNPPLSTSEILHEGLGIRPRPKSLLPANPDTLSSRLPSPSTPTRWESGRCASSCAALSKPKRPTRPRRGGAETGSRSSRRAARSPTCGARASNRRPPPSASRTPGGRRARREAVSRNGRDVVIAAGLRLPKILTFADGPPRNSAPRTYPTPSRPVARGIRTNIWIASKTPCATMQGSTLP